MLSRYMTLFLAHPIPNNNVDHWINQEQQHQQVQVAARPCYRYMNELVTLKIHLAKESLTHNKHICSIPISLSFPSLRGHFCEL